MSEPSQTNLHYYITNLLNTHTTLLRAKSLKKQFTTWRRVIFPVLPFLFLWSTLTHSQQALHFLYTWAGQGRARPAASFFLPAIIGLRKSASIFPHSDKTLPPPKILYTWCYCFLTTLPRALAWLNDLGKADHLHTIKGLIRAPFCQSRERVWP